MKTFFRSQNLWTVIEEGVQTEGADAKVLLESQKYDAKAFFLIQQAVDEPMFDRIVRFTTAKEAWEHIKTEYHGSARMVVSVRRQTLRQKFEEFSIMSLECLQLLIKLEAWAMNLKMTK